MDLTQCFLNLVILPSGLIFLMLVWPPLVLLRTCQWLLSFVFRENVHGKVVLITGSSSGIGEHLAYQYAKHGAKLILVARRDELLKEVAGRCQRLGATDVRIVTADVTREEECKRFVEETVNQFGRCKWVSAQVSVLLKVVNDAVDHLVNNAGVTHSYLFEEAADTESLHPVMDVTFWGAIYPTYFALPHLKKSGGKIVVTDSVAAWMPYPRMSMYNAAKAGVLSFYETLRVEIGNTVGITIATPGWIESEMTAGKFISGEGETVVKPEQRDVHVGPLPVMYAEECAKAMFSGVTRGQRYVRVPYWYTISLLYRTFAPELLDWTFRLLFIAKPLGSKVPPSKLILEMGAKDLLYPSSVLAPQKAE